MQQVKKIQQSKESKEANQTSAEGVTKGDTEGAEVKETEEYERKIGL